VVDGQKLWESSRIGISRLAGEDGISKSLVILVHHFVQECLVEQMRRIVEAQTAGRLVCLDTAKP